MGTPYCYLQKRIVPLEEARLPVMTHAFLYGTAVFEGVRGNWSEERGESLIFRPIDHFDRLKKSAHIMHIDLPQSAAEYVGKMQALGLRRFRVEMLRENATAAAALVTTYRRVLGGAEAASDAWRSLKAMNQLGVTRGTLQVV